MSDASRLTVARPAPSPPTRCCSSPLKPPHSRRWTPPLRSIRALPGWLTAIGDDTPQNTPATEPASMSEGRAVDEAAAQPVVSDTNDLDVLVLDDERPIRTLVRLLLKHAPGLRFAAEASDTPEAVELVREMQPEVVLVDLDVPGRDNHQVLARITEVAPESMVLVMSGLDATHEAEAAFEQGAFAYLEKSRLGVGLADDLRRLYRLFERARAGEDVWADGDIPRVLR